jgi:hypothetical protein
VYDLVWFCFFCSTEHNTTQHNKPLEQPTNVRTVFEMNKRRSLDESINQSLAHDLSLFSMSTIATVRTYSIVSGLGT